MEYIKLNNGMNMPVLGFGTFLAEPKDCERSVREALEIGYRLIDTAAVYQNEVNVGNAIRESGIPREDIFLVTKINFDSFENASASIETSLRKLQTEYVDLLLIHWPFGNYYAAWREMEKAVAAKKVKAIGISNFNPDRMIDLIKFNEIVPAVNQVEANLFCQRKEDRKWMEKYGVQPMAYAPLGQGSRNEMFSLPEVASLAEKYGKTPAQILLRFLTQEKIVSIPKSIHRDRIQENYDAMEITLTTEEIKALEALDRCAPQASNPEKPEKVEIAMSWIGK